MTVWMGSRPPQVRWGRPYVLKRHGRWLVLYGTEIVAVACCGSHARTYAHQWSVFHHAMAGAGS